MKYFGLLLLAVTAENFFFSRVFGLGAFLEKGFHKKTLPAVGILTVLSVTACVAVMKPLLPYLTSEPVMTFVLAVLASVVVLGLSVLLRAVHAEMYDNAEGYLPSLIINAAACSMLILKDASLGYAEAVLYAVGAGLGIVIAGLMMMLVMDKIRFADVPESFKGLPISLVCAALLSLMFTAFDGLVKFF